MAPVRFLRTAVLACLAMAIVGPSAVFSARRLLAFQADIRSGDGDRKLAVASNLPNAQNIERELADDFTIDTPQLWRSVSWNGLIVGGPGTAGNQRSIIEDVAVSFYRVFDNKAPRNRVPDVVSRIGGPEDEEFVKFTLSAGELNLRTAALITPGITVDNHIKNGINKLSSGKLKTGGEGPITGDEVLFEVDYTGPGYLLDPDHYFFVVSVKLSGYADHYWLSSPRPITPPGTAPIGFDGVAWVRDANLSPDWSKAGPDIVGNGLATNAKWALQFFPVVRK